MMQIRKAMESTSPVAKKPLRRIRIDSNTEATINSDDMDPDPLAQINGDYPDSVSTRRRRTEKLRRNMVINDDENEEDYPDERTAARTREPSPITEEDVRNNEKIVAQMSDIMKKLSTVNAFSNPLLDKLPKVIKTEPLQSVGTMLDASSKIYAFRVDHTHQECFIVRKDIGDEKELKKMRPERIGEGDEDIALEAGGANFEKRHSDEHDAEEAIDENQPGPSKKTKKPKKALPTVDEAKLKKTQEQMTVTIQKFRQVMELEDDVAMEHVSERFQFFADSVVDRLGSRRELVTHLERAHQDLEMDTDVHDLDEPYYHKATVGFEEGSTQSLLLKRVQTSRDGRFLLLHNKWRNMDFDLLSSQDSSREGSQDHEVMKYDQKVHSFCSCLEARVADTADITVGDLIPPGDDIEDFEELLEESVPTTPFASKQKPQGDENDNDKTLRFEEYDEHMNDDFAAGVADDDADQTLTVTIQDDLDRTAMEIDEPRREGMSKTPEPTLNEAQITLNRTAESIHDAEPPDAQAAAQDQTHQPIFEEEAPEEPPLDPGLQPVPDDSHWANAPNAPEKPKKPERRKRTESEMAKESGVPDLPWTPMDETDPELMRRIEALHIVAKPNAVAEKREKLLSPVGDTYNLTDNENVVYKYTDLLRMKLFYSTKSGFYRYNKSSLTSPIVWVSTNFYPGQVCPNGLDMSFDEFIQEYEKMYIEQEKINEAPNGASTAGELDVTMVPGPAEPTPNWHADEDSLVDFSNDSFNNTFEGNADLNATQLSATDDNMGRKSAELIQTGGVDLDKTGMSTTSQNLKSQVAAEPEYSDVEEVEINGMEIKIRPCRVKAIVVKKAMKKVLSKNHAEAKAIVRNGEEVVQDFKIQGTHSIGSLLAELPDYLRGRTKRDLNIVNAFSILLQMCNENNLYLHQEIGGDGMVIESAMSQFEIRNSTDAQRTPNDDGQSPTPRVPSIFASPMRTSPIGKKRPYPRPPEPFLTMAMGNGNQPQPSTSTNDNYLLRD